MPSSAWVLIVAQPPAEPDSREMLELVLAGATLEIELIVVFDGAGAEHLEPEPFAPWRQLVDFDLADLRARGAAPGLLPAGVDRLDDAGLERLLDDARGVLKL